jgi:hypothetical protein
MNRHGPLFDYIVGADIPINPTINGGGPDATGVSADVPSNCGSRSGIDSARSVGHWRLVACVSSVIICGLACCCARLTAVLPAWS